MPSIKVVKPPIVRQQIRLNRRQNQGFVLLLSILMMMMMLILTVTTLQMAAVEEKVTANQRIYTTAEFAAERAITEALNDIMKSTISNRGHENDPSWFASSAGHSSKTFYNASMGIYKPSNDVYGFRYTVQHKVINNEVMLDEQGSALLHIVGVGVSDKSERQKDVVVSLDYGPTFGLGAGLVGCEGVNLDSRVVTGSYSSSTKPSNNDKGGIKTIQPNGDVSVDGSVVIDGRVEAFGRLTMEGNAQVRYDAKANKGIHITHGKIGGDAFSESNISGAVKGSKHPNVSSGNKLVPQQLCDQVDVNRMMDLHSGIKSNNNNAAYKLETSYDNFSDSLIIGAADEKSNIYFSQLSLNGGRINIAGDVTLYLEGDMNMSGDSLITLIASASLTVYINGRFEMNDNSTINKNGSPSEVKFFSKVSDQGDADNNNNSSIYFDSNAAFYGVVYAPYANVRMNANTIFRGAVRGRTLYADGNTDFKYDEDLDSLALAPGELSGYELIYWAE